MTEQALMFRARRVVTPEGVRPATVHVADGRIVRVGALDETPAGEVVDAGDAVLLPGVVDAHVHVNEPGRTEWEGFETATRAAAAGGTTTIVDMPLNSIPATTTLDALRAKLAALEGRVHVDAGLWAGLVPGNVDQLRALHAAGVAGFKCFLVPSGVDEFPHVSEADLRAALPVLAELGATLIVHAEDQTSIDAATARLEREGADPRTYATYLASRPPESELRAIEMLVRLSRDTGARIHVVHLACGDAVPLVADAKREGLPFTAETCPHYLTFDAESVPRGATELKCAPPIREARHRALLWRGLEEGVIDVVVSDHSPCTAALKQRETGDFASAWGGIASLQLSLAATWTMARERGVAIERLARWMSAAPAALAGLDDRKGAIGPGRDADLVLFDPDASFVVDAGALAHKNKITPYAGRTLHGRVRGAWLRGERVSEEGAATGAPIGRFVPRRPA